jgi:UDP-N-acetyl-D-galactosamine dehydrogenase
MRGALSEADFIVVAVPTPVDAAHQPDFRPLLSASVAVGKHLKRGAVVVFESTVYPGATEEICIPVIERHSGMKWMTDFFVGYSPERINPATRSVALTRITKIVSGDTPQTLDRVAETYGAIIKAGVYRASSIRVAEAAKVIENTQRDLNIALMNELAIIFHRLGIDTLEVLEAAGTKWNFLPFRPGLVGGHCIGVDPYYLTHKAETIGYHPQVILSGRRINDCMGKYIAEQTVKEMLRSGFSVRGQNVIVLGFTFKENCPDIRNTRVIDVVRELEAYGAVVHVHDPIANVEDAMHEYGVPLGGLGSAPHGCRDGRSCGSPAIPGTDQ